MDFYRGKTFVIATKHKKGDVIAPILEHELGVICVTPEGLDTDTLGTFTGEVERVDDPISTLRKKCLMAIEATGIDVAVANEGSFGGHPTVIFAHADDELLMLVDKENGIEIVERELSLDTNFNGTDIHSVDTLIEFANRIGFPSHGIILKKAKDNYSFIIKENKTIDELIDNYNVLKNSDGTAYAETDMRAMYNPTRMKVIAKATERLVTKIKSLCPQCNTPGFGVVEAMKGLPCEMCGFPTRSTLQHIYRCQKCSFQTNKAFPFEKQLEDPQFCDHCNP